MLDRPGANRLHNVDGDAEVDGQDIAHGRVHHARTQHVEDDFVLLQAWRELVHKHRAQQFRIVVILDWKEILRIIHVANDRLARLYRGLCSITWIGNAFDSRPR